MCIVPINLLNLLKCVYIVLVVLIMCHVNDTFKLYGLNGLCRVNP